MNFEGEYQSLSVISFESNVVFYGREACKPNYTFKGNNVRDNYVIHYIEKGAGTFSTANHPSVRLQANDLFILPKGVPCFYQADAYDPWTYAWIGLRGVNIGKILNGSQLMEKNYLRQVQNSQLHVAFSELYQSLHASTSLSHNMLTESLLYRTFYQLLTEYPRQNSRHHALDQFQLALDYLHDNYSTGCTIQDLCQGLHLSHTYVYELFKQNSNATPQQFLTHLRMEDAKQQLVASSLPIQEIAERVGYKDSFTFSKAFKRTTGFSPTLYRQSQS